MKTQWDFQAYMGSAGYRTRSGYAVIRVCYRCPDYQELRELARKNNMVCHSTECCACYAGKLDKLIPS